MSMKISNIKNYTLTQFKASDNKNQTEQKPKTDNKNYKKAAIYIGSAAAISLAAYFIFKKPKKIASKVNSNKKITPKETPQTKIEETKILNTQKEETLNQLDISENKNSAEPPVAPPNPEFKPNAGPLPYNPKISNIEDFKPYFDGNFEIQQKELKNANTTTYIQKNENETFKDILVFNKENKLFRRITQYFNKNGQMWSRVYQGDESKILENPKNFPKSIYDSDFLVKEFSGEAKKPLGVSDISEGYERLTRVARPDGTAKTYQGFFNKNQRLHDYTIYYDKFNNNLGCFSRINEAQPEYVIKYNYAYNKAGQMTAIAKQDILKNNNWHGVYQNKGFDPFPMYINLKDGNGFKEFKGNLDIEYPEFDPDNF